MRVDLEKQKNRRSKIQMVGNNLLNLMVYRILKSIALFLGWKC